MSYKNKMTKRLETTISDEQEEPRKRNHLTFSSMKTRKVQALSHKLVDIVLIVVRGRRLLDKMQRGSVLFVFCRFLLHNKQEGDEKTCERDRGTCKIPGVCSLGKCEIKVPENTTHYYVFLL